MLILPSDVYEKANEGARDLIDSISEVKVDGRHQPYALIAHSRLTDQVLGRLRAALDTGAQRPYLECLDLVLDARAGRFRQISHRLAMSEVLLAYVNHDIIDGWLYATTPFGPQQPYLVHDIGQDAYSGLTFELSVSPADGQTMNLGSWWDEPEGDGSHGPDMLRPGRPETVLRRFGLTKETAALRAQYDQCASRMLAVLDAGPGVRLTMNGRQARSPGSRYEVGEYVSVCRRIVINDTRLSPEVRERCFPQDDDPLGSAPASVPPNADLHRTPLRCELEVFDLTANRAVRAHIDHLEIHRYDAGMRNRIVLPASHRRLIDILTGDLSTHVADVVEGKTAGNVILCKGRPGVGKTLTAEVYAETMRRPLFPIDMSVLLDGAAGSTSLRGPLELAYERARRWNAVLLIDEADVLVGKRGDDLNRNRLTAEFLRVTEYTDTLTFITTNRPDDVDEAILSRCAAIIDYQPPKGDDAVRAWRVLAQARGLRLPTALVGDLLSMFPGLAPREMRQLLRLVAQVSEHDERAVDVDLFAECAVFRGIVAAA